MNQFKPSEYQIVEQIKAQLSDFIKKTSVIDQETKSALLKDIGHNTTDDRFDGTKFISAAVGYAMYDWKNENLELMELWKSIAIANASVNNEPHLVADAAVSKLIRNLQV